MDFGVFFVAVAAVVGAVESFFAMRKPAVAVA